MDQSPNSQRGAIMVLTVIMLVLCSGLLSALYLTALSDNTIAQFKARKTIAFSSAESGAASAAMTLRNFAANFYGPPGSGSVTVNGISVNWTLQPALDSSGNPIIVQNTSADGFRVISKLFKITSTATYQGVIANISQYTSLDAMPIFQFLSFYNDDLEINPGAQMNLSGRIHSNNDIYLTNESGNVYAYNGTVRTAGNVYRKRKDSTSVPGGKVYIRNGTDVEMTTSQDSRFSGTYNGTKMDFAQMALARWGGVLKTAAHGVSKIEAPEVGSIQPYVANAANKGDYTKSGTTYTYTPGTGNYDKGFYNNTANMVIIDSKMYLGGVDVTSLLPASTITTKTMYDAREKKTVTMTEVDISKMKTATVTVGGVAKALWPSNGLLYAYRTDSTTTQPNGIRLVNGSELRNKLTVVSPNPVYIKGDYNSTNKKGSSVISDAVNLLSKSWLDSAKTSSSTSPPTPTATTFNVALITGSYDTVSGTYNGGFENFPRLHEKWSSSIPLTIKGSFVNIWDSQVAKGKWVYGGNIYTAPQRNWSFDTDYYDVNFLPPYTPNVYTLRMIAWWRTDRWVY
ncbi:MAG: hypothetical protein WC712_08510 [Candidatus Brocadiia bacterium]